MGAELMVFDTDAKLHSLFTVEELDLAVEQLNRSETIKSPEDVKLLENPQTSPYFRQKIRDNMAQLFTSFQARNFAEMGKLAIPHITVNVNQNVKSGTKVFGQLFTANQDAFPDKVFHVDFMLADGHLGAVETVWQGMQTSPYSIPSGKVIKATNKLVRVRSLVFFEFDDKVLITRVTWVHNEGVIEQQLLEAQHETRYPLYP